MLLEKQEHHDRINIPLEVTCQRQLSIKYQHRTDQR